MTVTHLGTTSYRGRKQRFGIRLADRRAHLYCLGKTGTGKSTLLRNLIVQDMEAGHGVGLIDPHGSLAEEVLEYVPSARARSVVYLDPADREHPVGFNVLGSVGHDERHLVVASVVGAFKSIWKRSWGPRLEFLLYNAVAALLETPGSTLLGVLRILRDERYRRRVVAQVRDPVLRRFWLDEERAGVHLRADAVAPVVNKVGQLLASPLVRNVLGQKRSRFSPRVTMERGGIFVANLGKGVLGAEQANLLGSLLVSAFGVAAMGRGAVAEHARRDFFLYVDEVHNFTTDAFGSMLAEARKNGLGLTLAHQHLDQLVPAVRQAIFGNVGTMVVFRVGAPDAVTLAQEFGDPLRPTDFANLPRYETYVRLLIDGTVSTPFSAASLPPWSVGTMTMRKRRIIRNSRERFGQPRATIEEEIQRWAT